MTLPAPPPPPPIYRFFFWCNCNGGKTTFLGKFQYHYPMLNSQISPWLKVRSGSLNKPVYSWNQRISQQDNPISINLEIQIGSQGAPPVELQV